MATSGFYVSEFVPIDYKSLEAFNKKKVNPLLLIKYGPGYDLTRTKKVERHFADLSVLPDGKDKGKGFHQLINTYTDDILKANAHERMNERLRTKPLQVEQEPGFDSFLTDEYYSKPFLDQLNNHPKLMDIPLKSQLATQKAKKAVHSTEEKKAINTVCADLKRDKFGLVRARLNGLRIQDDMASLIARGLEKNTHLQQLMLHDNVITDVGVDAICMALRWHPALRTLWLGVNNITDVGARHLATLLSRNRVIKELNISTKWPQNLSSSSTTTSAHTLHPHITHIGATYIAKELGATPCGGPLASLTSLSLAHQRVRDLGAIALFEAITGISNLNAAAIAEWREDRLSGDDDSYDIGNDNNNDYTYKEEEGEEYNPDKAATNHTTQSTFPRMHGLRTLSLQDNGLTSRCCLALQNALSSSNSHDSAGCPLQKLVLSHNEIDNDGAAQIATALTQNTSLRVLDLSWNQIGDAGLDALFVSVAGASEQNNYSSNTSITGLYTFNNRGEDDRAEILVSTRNTDNVFDRGTSQQLLLESAGGDSFQPDEKMLALLTAVSLSPPPPPLSSPATSATHSSNSSNKSNINNSIIHESNREKDTYVGDGEGKGQVSNTLYSFPSVPTASADPSAAARVVDWLPGDFRGVSMNGRSVFNSAHQIHEKHFKALDDGDAFVLAVNNTESARSSGIGPDNHRIPRLIKKKNNRFLAADKSLVNYYSSNVPNELKTSKDLGRTIGVPTIPSMGAKPVRSAVSSLQDSGQQLMYLQVATPNDRPGDQPRSILLIAKERREEIARVRAERQTDEYKLAKIEAMEVNPYFNAKVQQSASAIPKAPPKFWEQWRKRVRLTYYNGIDNAANVTSTKLEPISAEEKEGAKWEFDVKSGVMIRTIKDPKQQYQRHLAGKRAQDITPGAVLAARLKEKRLQAEEKEERKRQQDEAAVLEKQRRKEELKLSRDGGRNFEL